MNMKPKKRRCMKVSLKWAGGQEGRKQEVKNTRAEVGEYDRQTVSDLSQAH